MASTPGFRAEDAVREKMQGGQFNFLVIGRYNVGKSTLINTMFLRGEGRRAEESTDSKPCTDKVKCYSSSVLEGGQLNIYDTPGLQDGNETFVTRLLRYSQLVQSTDRSYLTSIEKACSNYHLVIYCTKMKGAVRPAEIETLKEIAAAFKSDVWKHLIIALTCANEVQPPHEDDDEKEYFKHELKTKKDRLRDAFKKMNQEKVFNEFISKRVYPVGSGRVIKLPTTDDWRVDFMCGCQEACCEGESGKILHFSYKIYPYLKGVAVGGVAGVAIGGAATVVGTGALAATALLSAKAMATGGAGAALVPGGRLLSDYTIGQLTENKTQRDEDEHITQKDEDESKTQTDKEERKKND